MSFAIRQGISPGIMLTILLLSHAVLAVQAETPRRASTAVAAAPAPASAAAPSGPSITHLDPSDPPFKLQAGEVAIEYIAHACFRIHSPSGARVLIDPYANRVWLGYDFPRGLATDAILITHPHYDHDGGEFNIQQRDKALRQRGLPESGQRVPWAPDVRVLREPGIYSVAGIQVTGIRGKHAEPYGQEFGRTNTIWLLEVADLRIVHLGDNGPLTEVNIRELGRVDILMMPIDEQQHLLKEAEIQAIRSALRPRILIPMHYRHPDLELDARSPSGLGPIDPWLAHEQNVTQLKSNRATFSTASLPPGERILVFPHSPLVRAPEQSLVPGR